MPFQREPSRSNPFTVSIIEVNDRGGVFKKELNVYEFAKLYILGPDRANGPEHAKGTLVSYFRDLRLFVRNTRFTVAEETTSSSEDSSVAGGFTGLPAILPRPGANFYMLDLFKLKIICRQNKCVILDNEVMRSDDISGNLLVHDFVRNLVENLRSPQQNFQGSPCLKWPSKVIKEFARSCWNLQKPSDFSDAKVPFELVVLDSALNTVTSKFHRHQCLIQPILNLLLDETISNPSDMMLRRMLALKKSLQEFETNVHSLKKAIVSILHSNEDMADLYLGENREDNDHEEVELLMEGYRDDVTEVLLSVVAMRNQIDDTDDFINTHLNETRNRIIQMSLYMEMGMLGVSSSACIAGIFGMNLHSRIEEHEYAFFIVTGVLLAIGLAVIFFFALKLSNIPSEHKKARKYNLFENFFVHLDEIEVNIFADDQRGLTKSEFGRTVAKIIGKQVTQEEINVLFDIFDIDHNGVLEEGEFRHMMGKLAGRRQSKKKSLAQVSPASEMSVWSSKQKHKNEWDSEQHEKYKVMERQESEALMIHNEGRMSPAHDHSFASA